MNDPPVVVVRYAEIGLKGGNRREFEKALAANLKHALKGTPHGPVERPRGRVIIRDPADPGAAAERAAMVFGVSSVSPGVATAADASAISAASRALAAAAIAARPGEGPLLFAVRASRSDKSFPLTSMELSARLGRELLDAFPRLRVNLTRPEITLGVEVRRSEALLYLERIDGPGGIPVGTTGKAVSLLSGGIDSPAASWLTMKRGARVLFITFHSYPFISAASLDKVKEIVRRLARYQHGAVLYAAPFADIQVAIKKACPEALRTMLYRRMMARLGCRLARREGALALVTGESLGQVASQTMENIRAIADASDLPILRPLIAYDKNEAIELARRIGTYDVSIQPQPDCCTVFLPRRPALRPSPADAREAEAALDVEGLIAGSFEKLDEFIFPA